MNELTVPYKCCGEGTYWHPDRSICTSSIDPRYNDNKCLVFDSHDRYDCL